MVERDIRGVKMGLVGEKNSRASLCVAFEPRRLAASPIRENLVAYV